MDILKILIIIVFVLLYWKLFYYKYHKKDITPISYFIVGGLLCIYGVLLFYNKTVVFDDIKTMYMVTSVSLIYAFSLVIYGITKKGLVKNVDITLTWARKAFPKIHYSFWMILAFPAIFFIMTATRKLLGEEFIVFWSMILLAHARSNYRLYKFIRSKNEIKK